MIMSMSTEQASTNEQQTPLEEEHAQPDVDAAEMNSAGDKGGVANDAAPSPGVVSARGVIWTPAFIVLFGFTLVAGLSTESLLTQGWLDRWYEGQWVFQGHVILVGIGWLVLLVCARTRWVRVGAVFGLAWALFMTVDIFVQVTLGAGVLDILAHVNVLICLSLLACSICLTVDRYLLSSWDAWVLGLLPLVGAVAAAALFPLWPDRSLFSLENSIASVALALSGLVWLVRPSCWRGAPGLTVLFGLVPIILIGLDAANDLYNAVNFFLARVVLSSQYNVSILDVNFFCSQVALLCLLLGTMRLIKSELVN